MWQMIAKGLVAVLGKALIASGSEQMLKWTMFKIADVVVESTKTPHDNEWLKEFKDSYNKVENK